MTKKYMAICLVVLGVNYLTPSAFAAQPWGPWKMAKTTKTAPANVWMRGFQFYQEHFSSKDGAACPFYPTCSAFSREAMTKHGALYGSLLTIDRLFSEYPGMPQSGLYPLITKYGIHRPYDPVP